MRKKGAPDERLSRNCFHALSFNAFAAVDCRALAITAADALGAVGDVEEALRKALRKHSSVLLNDRKASAAANVGKLKTLVARRFAQSIKLGEALRAADTVCKKEDPAIREKQAAILDDAPKYTAKTCAADRDDIFSILK